MCTSPVSLWGENQFIGLLWVEREREEEGIKAACAVTLQVATW